jgi:GNAT superfamily N-acetyltransferase
MDKKTVYIKPDEYTAFVSKSFDYDFDGHSYFQPFEKPIVPSNYNLGVIIGASGTGKSTLLKEFGTEEIVEWNPNKAIISHFDTPEDGVNKLSAIGLNSIPSWCKPYHVLSTGEKFRADVARKLHSNSIIDEFTSVVDRNVAKATSYAVQKYVRKNNIYNVVLASCHEDILEWLEPDWTFNTNSGLLSVGRSLRRPEINIEVYRCKYNLWEMFKNHHYLSNTLNKASRCFVGVWDNQIIAFTACITYPSGTVKNSWRESRTVIIPDYQGMGIGTRFSDAIAQIFVDEGKRYFSRTAHPRMGEYRNHSPLWKPTSKNGVIRKDIKETTNGNFNNWFVDSRVCYSHEYIGV